MIPNQENVNLFPKSKVNILEHVVLQVYKHIEFFLKFHSLRPTFFAYIYLCRGEDSSRSSFWN